MKHAIVMVAIAALTAACASISSESGQTLLVTAMCEGKPVNGATCTLSNSKGNWKTQTPGSVLISQAFGDLTVTCKKGSMQSTRKFESSTSGAFWGNVLAGGGIGMIVDANTGAGFKYDNVLKLDMQPPCE